jgi:hypothetical protein
MSIRGAVYSLLNGVDSAVYPVYAPQETTGSYVVYSMRLSPIRCQEGIEMTEIDLTIEVYAESFDDAVTLANSFYSALENASGTYDGESLEVCNWESETEDYISDLQKINITQEYNLKFN